jgi:hypothetical protein
MVFSDWMTKKFVEWRDSLIGQDGSMKKFAIFIGVSSQLMQKWTTSIEMGGSVPNELATIKKLYAKYGQEVYDVLGIEMGDIGEELDQIPPEYQTIYKKDKNEFKNK